MEIDLFFTFLLLVGLELVLGIDNVLLIAILSGRLPEESREKARKLGLTLAMGIRILLVFGVTAIQRLSRPLIYTFSGRDLILLAGGLFLIYKAVKEIHHVVEKSAEEAKLGAAAAVTFGGVITQILLLDVVFSIDSVITAIGLTNSIFVIVSAIIVSFAVVLVFSTAIAGFIIRNPTLKILALAFLVCIGVTIFMEGLHKEVPKAYIYLPMGFALGVELLQLRYTVKHRETETASH